MSVSARRRGPRMTPARAAAWIKNGAMTADGSGEAGVTIGEAGGEWGQRSRSLAATLSSSESKENAEFAAAAAASRPTLSLSSPSDEVSLWGRARPARGPASSGVLPRPTFAAESDSMREMDSSGGQAQLPPIAQISRSMTALPMVRTAAAAVHAPSPRSAASGSYSARASASPSGGSGLSARAHAFSTQLLTRHCDAAMVDGLTAAHNLIDSLRLEVSLLRHANDALSHPGRMSDGESVITPFSFSQENFIILYRENQRCKELLQANVARFDALTAEHKRVGLEADALAQRIQQMEQEAVSERIARAALEQQDANRAFELTQERRRGEATQTRAASLEIELNQTRVRLSTLESDHARCAISVELASSERRAFAQELAEREGELRTLAERHEQLATHAASVEGMHAAATAALADARAEVAALKGERASDAEHMSLGDDKLQRAQVVIVRLESALERARTDREHDLSQSARVASEQSRSILQLQDSHAALAAALASAKAAEAQAVQGVRAMLEAERAARARDKERFEQQRSRELRDAKHTGEGHALALKEAEKLSRQVAAQAASQRSLKDALQSTKAQVASLTVQLAESRSNESAAREQLAGLQAPAFASGGRPGSGTGAATGDSSQSLLASLRECRLQLDQLRRTHASCSSRIALAEREVDRESSLRKVEARAAQEARRKLEHRLAGLQAQVASKEARHSGHKDTTEKAEEQGEEAAASEG